MGLSRQPHEECRAIYLLLQDPVSAFCSLQVTKKLCLGSSVQLTWAMFILGCISVSGLFKLSPPLFGGYVGDVGGGGVVMPAWTGVFPQGCHAPVQGLPWGSCCQPPCYHLPEAMSGTNRECYR